MCDMTGYQLWTGTIVTCSVLSYFLHYSNLLYMNGIASLFAWQQRQTSSCPEDRVPFYAVEILDGMGKTSANAQGKAS